MIDWEVMQNWYSQKHTAQDQWVAANSPEVTAGTFLDIGCGHWMSLSNTLALEMMGWSGIGVDIDDHAADYRENRPGTRFVQADATVADYADLLVGMPVEIDYLSIDIEPPGASWRVLKRVIQSGRTFRLVTFEHDHYRIPESSVREASRAFMAQQGYSLVMERHDQDDFYRHNSGYLGPEVDNSTDLG